MTTMLGEFNLNMILLISHDLGIFFQICKKYHLKYEVFAIQFGSKRSYMMLQSDCRKFNLFISQRLLNILILKGAHHPCRWAHRIFEPQIRFHWWRFSIGVRMDSFYAHMGTDIDTCMLENKNKQIRIVLWEN